jgi:hypothetical protein
LLRILTAQQLEEWFEYYKLEPFGSLHEDTQQSYTRYTVAIANGLERKNKVPFEVNDWAVLNRKPKKEHRQTTEDMKSIMMAVAGVMNGNKKKGRGR